jgi:hypothetical protein
MRVGINKPRTDQCIAIRDNVGLWVRSLKSGTIANGNDSGALDQERAGTIDPHAVLPRGCNWITMKGEDLACQKGLVAHGSGCTFFIRASNGLLAVCTIVVSVTAAYVASNQ